jgi:hypothetical protein
MMRASNVNGPICIGRCAESARVTDSVARFWDDAAATTALAHNRIAGHDDPGFVDLRYLCGGDGLRRSHSGD